MRKLSILFITLFAFTACTKQRDLTGCDAVVCKSGYVTVAVQVTYAGPTKAEVDEVYTVNTKTGERINFNQNLGAGYFIVLNDSYRPKMVKQTIEFHLMAKREGAVVLDEPYTISADCCHVNKVSGNDIVIVR